MSSATEDRDSKQYASAPHEPAVIALPMAAGASLVRGCFVLKDSSGNAHQTTGSTSSAIGVCKRSVDNSTGNAGDKTVEAMRGVFGFANSSDADLITNADRFSECFVADNQTVAKTSDGGSRSRAGIVWDVAADGTVYVLVGPTVSLETQGIEDDIAALEDNALTSQACIPVPLGSFRIYSTGGALVPFNDGVADGIDPTAESIGFKFNVGSTAKIAASVLMPNDLDDTADVVVHVLGFRVGASDTTAALAVGAFFRVAGAAFSADADAGGDTDAFAGATTVVSEVTCSIAAGDVPASPSSLLLTLVPTAALDADDLVILEVWLEYTRKLLDT